MVANLWESCVACMHAEKILPCGPVEVATAPEATGAQWNAHVNVAGWARLLFLLLLLLPFYPSKAWVCRRGCSFPPLLASNLVSTWDSSGLNQCRIDTWQNSRKILSFSVGIESRPRYIGTWENLPVWREYHNDLHDEGREGKSGRHYKVCMCHALVFNIHHVVTHSTRVPLFLPPRSEPIQVNPMVGKPPMSLIRWCRSRRYFLRMWGGREGDYVSFEAKFGLPRGEDHWEEGPHKVKRIRANGWVWVQGAGWARGEGRGRSPRKKRLCKKHVIVFVPWHASNTNNVSTS